MLAVKSAVQSGTILCEFHKHMKQKKEKKNKETKCSCFPILSDRFSADFLVWDLFPLENKEEPQRSMHESLSLELTSILCYKGNIPYVLNLRKRHNILNPACDTQETITLTESLISTEKSKNLFWVCLEQS